MFKLFKKLSVLIDTINAKIGGFSAWLVLGMILIGAWNVLGRYVGRFVGTNLSSNTLLEMQWQLFAAVFLLGAADTLQQNDHVRVDVLFKNLTLKQQAIANLLGTVFFLLPFAITVVYMSWNSVWTACAIWERSPNPGGLPLCPAKALVIIGFLLLIAQGGSEAIKSWEILRTKTIKPKETHHG